MSRTESNSPTISEPIVDVDVHLEIPQSDLASYTDDPHASWLESPGIQFKSSGWDPTLGGKIPSRSVASPETLRADVIEGLEIDVPILNVFHNLSRLSQTDTAVALQRACNDWLLEEFLAGTDFSGLATVQTQRPDAAAEELDRVGSEDGIVGVFLPTTGPDPPLGDPSYDPLYEAAVDNGLTPVFHGATNSGFDVGFPKYNRAFEKFIEAHVNAHLWSQAMTVTSLVVHGAPVKFPELDFVVLEAGIGWVPYLMFRLNKEAAMRRAEVPLLEDDPESHIRDAFYFASQPLGEPTDSTHMAQLLEMVGVDSLLFASDYPHWDFDHPNELYGHLNRHFDAEERERILSKNATEVFDLD